ncbi:MAG: response regulator [Ignavibacteriaceae bacterium]|nr:MAG: response regulator [Ignavibacteriaceae bacterium]
MEDYLRADVLLVEDNPYDAELTIRALKKQGLANQIFNAVDGVEALDFIFCRGKFSNRDIDHPVKVVLLDLKLPKLNGLEVLKEVKSNPKTSKIPVVVLTSSREDPDMNRAYELGANSYVVKPVDFDDFIKAVQQTGLFWLLVNETEKL